VDEHFYFACQNRCWARWWRVSCAKGYARGVHLASWGFSHVHFPKSKMLFSDRAPALQKASCRIRNIVICTARCFFHFWLQPILEKQDAFLYGLFLCVQFRG